MNFWLISDTLTNNKLTKWYKSRHCINNKQNQHHCINNKQNHHHHHWINNKQNLTAMKGLLRCFTSCVLLGIVYSCQGCGRAFCDYSGPIPSRGGKYFLIETEDSKYFLHWMMTWLITKQAGLYRPNFVKYFKTFYRRSYISCVILLI